MKTFDFKSGTKVMVDEHQIVIERSGGKSAMKGLFAGRAMGQMTIKMSALTGLIYYADYMVICASGLATANDFKNNECKYTRIYFISSLHVQPYFLFKRYSPFPRTEDQLSSFLFNINF
jgi:hypothetical protein